MKSIDPINLLSHKRLDIICKYLFFKELINNPESINKNIEILYDKHILKRTGGVEPTDIYGNHEAKYSLKDYKDKANILLKSIIKNGFDQTKPIPYSKDGTLGNGAHRLSVSLASNIPVFIKKISTKGMTWDFQWFVDNGFSIEELQQILYSYAELKSDKVVMFVFFSPSFRYWSIYEKIISEKLDIVGSVCHEIKKGLDVYNLVHDIYETLDMASSLTAINRKAFLLSIYKPLKIKVVLAEKNKYAGNIYQISTEIKNKCREISNEYISNETYLSIHAASSPEETKNISRILLSPNNMKILAQRNSFPVRQIFLDWISELRYTCKNNNININDICIVGSSPLEVLGIRNSTDIDFTIKSLYRRKKYGSGITHITKNIDIVTEGYHRCSDGNCISDDQLIDNPDNHFIFRGIKFANPEIVLERKRYSMRPKDIIDIELSKEYFNDLPNIYYNPEFHYSVLTELIIRKQTENIIDKKYHNKVEEIFKKLIKKIKKDGSTPKKLVKNE